MAGTLPTLSAEILALTNDHERIAAALIMRITSANPQHREKHLQSLVAANHLSKHGTNKRTWHGRAFRFFQARISHRLCHVALRAHSRSLKMPLRPTRRSSNVLHFTLSQTLASLGRRRPAHAHCPIRLGLCAVPLQFCTRTC